MISRCVFRVEIGPRGEPIDVLIVGSPFFRGWHVLSLVDDQRVDDGSLEAIEDWPELARWQTGDGAMWISINFGTRCSGCPLRLLGVP